VGRAGWRPHHCIVLRVAIRVARVFRGLGPVLSVAGPLWCPVGGRSLGGCLSRSLCGGDRGWHLHRRVRACWALRGSLAVLRSLPGMVLVPELGRDYVPLAWELMAAASLIVVYGHHRRRCVGGRVLCGVEQLVSAICWRWWCWRRRR